MTHKKTAKGKRMFIKENIKTLKGKELEKVYAHIEKKKGMR